MPMPIQSLEEFDKVLNVSWYNPERPREEQAYVSVSFHDIASALTVSDSHAFCPFLKCIRSVASTFAIS